MPGTVRIVSWNVNGVRSVVKKGLLDWLATESAAVVGLQEIRAAADQVPLQLREHSAWNGLWTSGERRGYSGVGLLTRRPPDEVVLSLGVPEFDSEGRFQLVRLGRLWIANVYFPNGNGKDRDNSRIPFKLAFYRRVFDVTRELVDAGEPVLVMGDFNTAHRDIDLARPRQNVTTSGFRPEEREELDRWLQEGWTDTFRVFCDEAGQYSWWSQRRGVRERNIGWRIDYVLASAAAVPHVRGAFIDAAVTGSDHCPVGVEIDAGLLPDPAALHRFA